MKWIQLIFASILASAAVAACSSSDSGSSQSSGKPSTSAGCNAYCVAQGKLQCGIPVATCYDLCRAAVALVNTSCQSQYEAAELCQSQNLSCKDSKTLEISGCTNEMLAYSNCASDGGLGDAGGD